MVMLSIRTTFKPDVGASPSDLVGGKALQYPVNCYHLLLQTNLNSLVSAKQHWLTSDWKSQDYNQCQPPLIDSLLSTCQQS